MSEDSRHSITNAVSTQQVVERILNDYFTPATKDEGQFYYDGIWYKPIMGVGMLYDILPVLASEIAGLQNRISKLRGLLEQKKGD